MISVLVASFCAVSRAGRPQLRSSILSNVLAAPQVICFSLYAGGRWQAMHKVKLVFTGAKATSAMRTYRANVRPRAQSGVIGGICSKSYARKKFAIGRW